MATIVPTPSGTYKALVRMKGWPTVSKTFRLKRDAIGNAKSPALRPLVFSRIDSN